jgi:hypothetical protein
MKHLLLCALLLLIMASGCETPQEAAKPDPKPTVFDSTASIEFSKIDDTTYIFVMHKADARLHTEWMIEGMAHTGDIHTHTFATRGEQLIQGRLLDSANVVVRTLDTVLFVVEPPPAEFFTKCKMIIIYYGEHRFSYVHRGEYTELEWRFYPAPELDPVSLRNGSFKDYWSAELDDSDPWTHYDRAASITCTLQLDRKKLLSASLSQSISTNMQDRENFRQACTIKNCDLVRSDADTVIYRFEGVPGPTEGEFILDGDNYKYLGTNIKGTLKPHVDVVFARPK